MFLLILFSILLLIVVISFLNKKEKYVPFFRLRGPYNSPGGIGGCEFSRDCLANIAKTSQMSNGLQGVCTAGGVVCPSFSLDQYDKMINLGMVHI